MKFLVPLLVILFSLQAFSFEQTRWLRSDDGVELWLEYSYKTHYYNSNKPSKTVFASPLEIRAKLPTKKENSQIRVVLTSHGEAQAACGRDKTYNTQEVFMDLKYDSVDQVYRGSFEQDAMEEFVRNGKKITRRVDTDRKPGPIVLYNGYCEYMPYWMDLSFVVDDRWQTDPANGTTHFYPKL